MALSSHFTGRVAQREYAQTFDFEYAGGVRSLVTAKVVEQSFRFTGCSYSDAHTTSDVSVTDNNGTVWTVPMKSSIVDGSAGFRVMIAEEVNVQRTPITPHMWEVVVTRRGSRYFVNGTKVVDGPAWIADYV